MRFYDMVVDQATEINGRNILDYFDGEGIAQIDLMFSVKGDDLAKLLGVQKRTLQKHIAKTSPKSAQHMMISYLGKQKTIPLSIRKAIRGYIAEELDYEYNFTITDLDLSSEQVTNSAIIDSINKQIDFLIQFDVIIKVRE